MSVVSLNGVATLGSRPYHHDVPWLTYEQIVAQLRALSTEIGDAGVDPETARGRWTIALRVVASDLLGLARSHGLVPTRGETDVPPPRIGERWVQVYNSALDRQVWIVTGVGEAAIAFQDPDDPAHTCVSGIATHNESVRSGLWHREVSL